MAVQNGPRGSAAPRGGASWLFVAIWLVYLIIPINDLVGKPHSTAQLVSMVLGIAAFCACYCLLIQLGFPEQAGDGARADRIRSRRALIGLLALLALVLPIVVFNELFTLWIYVSAAAGGCLPMDRYRTPVVAGVAATAAMTIEGALLGVSSSVLAVMLLPGLFSCLGSFNTRRTRQLIRQLESAREEVRQLAASEERLRLSRDLHDLAGHSLATITLKAELARRLLEADPAAAAKQLADLEQVSRQALTDIREAVSGYRRPTLAVELLSAKTALAAAGVGLRAGPEIADPVGLDPEAEAALAWCLREATTNIVRHSKAAGCTVRLIPATVDGAATLTLEVVDDGQAQQTDTGCAPERAYGNGLTGLAERLAAASGTLSAGPLVPHGFRVSATVPIAATVPLPEARAAAC